MWVNELHNTLWGVLTSARDPTGKTAYPLVFGSEVVLQAELALPSYRVFAFDEVSNKRQRCLDLDLLNERRIATLLKAEVFKQRTMFAHDKSLVNKPISVGD